MSLDEIIRKKGNYLILKKLKFKPLNYNLIKKNIIAKISARTLDFRLKELTQFCLIESKILDKTDPVRKKYSLTKKGLIFLSSFEALEQLINNQILPEDFNDKFSSRLVKNIYLNFDKIWKELKDILLYKKILYTLKTKSPNEILEINDTGIVVKTKEGIDKIPIDKIENAWINFVKDEYLERNNHNKATYRSSFMLTLFSQLPFVKVDDGPPLTIKLQP